MDDATGSRPTPPDRLGEIGLSNYAPYLMNRIMGRYNADLREEANALGLTTPKMRSLAVLAVVDKLLISELAVYAVVEKSTLSRALAQLEDSGWVSRIPDTQDNRATRVTITDQGREAFGRLWPTMAAAYESLFEGIPAEERQGFVATLQKMLGNIRQHDF